MKENDGNFEVLIEELLLVGITWIHTGDVERPYQVEFDGHSWEIRVNDWPESETVYSLVLAGKAVRNLQSLPTNWLMEERDARGN